MNGQHDLVLTLTCRGCGRNVAAARLGGPVPVIHQYSAGKKGGWKYCRYVVTPDPFGQVHKWAKVPREMSVEMVLRELRHQWDERWSRALLEALMS